MNKNQIQSHSPLVLCCQQKFTVHHSVVRKDNCNWNEIEVISFLPLFWYCFYYNQGNSLRLKKKKKKLIKKNKKNEHKRFNINQLLSVSSAFFFFLSFVFFTVRWIIQEILHPQNYSVITHYLAARFIMLCCLFIFIFLKFPLECWVSPVLSSANDN